MSEITTVSLGKTSEYPHLVCKKVLSVPNNVTPFELFSDHLIQRAEYMYWYFLNLYLSPLK